VQARIHATVVE
jgi:hypothetical protein